MTVYDAAYFANLRKERADNTAEILAGMEPAAVLSSEEVPLSSLSKRTNLGKLANLAAENGWQVKVGQSEYFTGDHLQANGKVRPGKHGVHKWFQAVRGGTMLMMNDLPDFRINGRMVDMTEFTAKIEEAY